jgi:hypothetical protein
MVMVVLKLVEDPELFLNTISMILIKYILLLDYVNEEHLEQVHLHPMVSHL